MLSKLRSLKVAISLIVIGIIFILMTVLAWSLYNTSYSSLHHVYVNEMKNINRIIKQQTEVFIEQQVKNAKEYASNPVVVRAVVTGNYTLAKRYMANTFKIQKMYENVFISTAERDSMIIVSGMRNSKTIGLRFRKFGYASNIDATLSGKVHVSSAGKSPVTGLAVQLITVPIKAGNRVRAIFGLPINLGEYSATMNKNLTIGKTGYPFIIDDAKGVYISHPERKLIFNLDLKKFKWGRTLLNLKNNKVGRYTYKGKAKLGIANISKKYGFRVVSSGYESDITSEVWSLIVTMIIDTLIGVIIASLIIFFFVRYKLVPVEKIKDLMVKISKGDLSHSYEGKVSKDEVGQLVGATNEMVTNLRDMVSRIMKSATEFSYSSEQITATSESLSQGSNEQAANSEEIASSLEEMGATIAQNAENSRDTDVIAQKNAKQAVEGGTAVQETVSAMNNIADKINLIEEIAYQTNLLALNAAIEAARAGIHGKGFAVVASEVRKLAEKSQVASKEIGELAGTSVEVAQKAGDLLDEIVPNIKKTAELVQDISVASEQQDTGVNQINIGMSELNSVIQQNASASEELAATAEVLQSNALELQTLMNFFTIESNKSQKYVSNTSRDEKVEALNGNGNDNSNENDNSNGNGKHIFHTTTDTPHEQSIHV